MHDPITPRTQYERLMPPDAIDPSSVGKPVRRIRSVSDLLTLRQALAPLECDWKLRLQAHVARSRA